MKSVVGFVFSQLRFGINDFCRGCLIKSKSFKPSECSIHIIKLLVTPFLVYFLKKKMKYCDFDIWSI